MNYSESGVDIDLGNKVKSGLKTKITATRPEVLGKISGFGGLFNFQAQDYKDPVLVSSTDGVGSKLKLVWSNLGILISFLNIEYIFSFHLVISRPVKALDILSLVDCSSYDARTLKQ